MRYEVHLVHAPPEAHAGLLRIARGDPTVSERALADAMRSLAGGQVVARYGSVRAAERLQAKLTEAGCSAVVVDRGSALSRWLEERFGSHESAATTSPPPQVPAPEASDAAPAPAPPVAQPSILRQDADLRRRAEQAEFVLRWKRRAMGAILGAVAFALVAGVLAVVSSVVKTERLALPDEAQADSERSGQAAAGAVPPAPEAVGDESGGEEPSTEVPTAAEGGPRQAATQEPASQSNDSSQAEATPARDLVPPNPQPPLRPDTAADGSAARIVGSVVVFLLAMSVGFGLLYLVRRLTDSLPAGFRRALRIFAAAAFVFIAAAAALVQVQVSRRDNAAAAALSAASDQPAELQTPSPSSAAEVTDPAAITPQTSVRSFVAQLGPPEQPRRFGPMAERLMAPPAEGSGDDAAAGEGSGLRPAGEWVPALEEEPAASADVRSFVASLPGAAVAAEPDCPHGSSEFARMACALRTTEATDSGSRVELVAREAPEEEAAPSVPPAEQGGEPAAAMPQAGSGENEVAAVAEPDQAPAQSLAQAPPDGADSALPEGVVPGEDAADPAPSAPPPPTRSPYATPAVAGFGSGTMLELLLMPWIRRRRRSS